MSELNKKASSIDIHYEPSEKQSLFHQSVADECFYGGAKGGGKSVALVFEAVSYCLYYPQSRAFLFRESFPQLKRTLIYEFKDKIPKGLYKWNEQSQEARLLNGSVICFAYAETYEQAKRDYQGLSADFIGVDEVTQLEPELIRHLIISKRSGKGYPTRFRATGNPGGIGHQFVKNRYIIPTGYGKNKYTDRIEHNGEVYESKIEFIPSTVYDNPYVNKEYKFGLETASEFERQAYLLGNWDIFEGQYFEDFKGEAHVVEPFKIPDHWDKYASLDYGMDMAAVLWYAVDNFGRIYVYREMNQPKLTLSDCAKTVLSYMEKGEQSKIKYIVASPDLWNKRQETMQSGFEIMTAAGLKNLIKANNSRVPGWRALREYLSLKEDEYGEKSPSIFFFNTCKTIIENIPMLQHDMRDPEDVDSKKNHDITHAPDSLRYFISSRPQRSKQTQKDEFNFFSRREKKTSVSQTFGFKSKLSDIMKGGM